MKEFINTIFHNKEWLFSGIGVTALIAIIGLFIKRKKEKVTINQAIVGNRNNQAGRNINKDVNQNDKIEGDVNQKIEGDENNQAGSDIQC